MNALQESIITETTASRILWGTAVLPFFVIPATLFAFWSVPSWAVIHETIADPIGIAVFIVGMLAHELLHALGFCLGGAPLSAIRFGFDRKAMTPYVSCTEMIPAAAYQMAILLPALVLAVVPTIYAIKLGSLQLSLWAALMLSGCCWDFCIYWAARKVPLNAKARQHDKQLGCLYALE